MVPLSEVRNSKRRAIFVGRPFGDRMFHASSSRGKCKQEGDKAGKKCRDWSCWPHGIAIERSAPLASPKSSFEKDKAVTSEYDLGSGEARFAGLLFPDARQSQSVRGRDSPTRSSSRTIRGSSALPPLRSRSARRRLAGSRS